MIEFLTARRFITLLLLLSVIAFSFSRYTVDKTNWKSPSKTYDSTLQFLEKLIQENGDFALGVYATENTVSGLDISYNDFDDAILQLTLLVGNHLQYQHTINYHQPDSNNYLKNSSLNQTIFGSLQFNIWDANKTAIKTTPFFRYDEYPMIGKNSTREGFVSQLLKSGKGNCHSLSYLYKIIADKIGAKCWLALAPNHIYIKNFSQQYGWYNTELTSRSFPSDAWIMASGYISGDAIRSKIYMDTLSNQQSIGLCILDLAKAYEYETKNYYDGFILKCCDLVLQYHTTNPMALLLKAESLKKVYLKQKAENALTIKQAFNEMEKAYITLAKLHYREMPKEMYDKWVRQLQKKESGSFQE